LTKQSLVGAEEGAKVVKYDQGTALVDIILGEFDNILYKKR
jgi:hypothetical protein